METKQEARTLVKKLAAIMGEVSRVPKSGRNDFHRYDYATEADIAEAVRKGMAERSIILIPSVEKTELADIPTKTGTQKLCTLTVRFTLEDGESGETRAFTIIGQGTDAGDKASYKAMTGAEKYALMKLFLIPTGDDPERDEKPAPKATKPAKPPTTREAIQAPKYRGQLVTLMGDPELLKAAQTVQEWAQSPANKANPKLAEALETLTRLQEEMSRRGLHGSASAAAAGGLFDG